MLYSYCNPDSLSLADCECDGALSGNLDAGDNDPPASGPHGGEGNAAMESCEQSVSPRRLFRDISYHVDVTCCPSGCVLMTEQAYSLPSGPTRTGLMDSWLHPGARH